jgi:geranylgeranyl reductase family protein
MYDVVISGAGPSGSHCSRILAEAGYKVALIEKDTNWRKPCGGSVSSNILNLYPQINKLNIAKIKGTKIFSANLHSIEKRRDDNLHSAVVDRLEFDNLIRNIAVEKGAELFDNNLSYDFVIKEGKKIGIKTKSKEGIKEYHGKILILADGMSSKLALKTGLRSKWDLKDISICKCAIMEGKNNLDYEYNYLFFQNYMGYGWIFPLGKNRFNIGCGASAEIASKLNLNKMYEQFINNQYIKKNFLNSDYRIIWTASYPLPMNGIVEDSLYSDNLMCIGDVAGYVSPITGEGIYQSIYSAKAAADVAIQALEKEDYSKDTLKAYKTHPDVKKMKKLFRTLMRFREFLFEKEGKNLNEMLARAEKDTDYREKTMNLFFAK